MKKFALIPLLILSIIILGGCGTKPEATVSSFFEAAKTFNFEKMATYVNSANAGKITNITTNNDLEKYFVAYLKENAFKLTYKIDKTTINGNTAVVSVTCKYIDATPLITATIGEYFQQALGIAFSGAKLTDKQVNSLISGIMTEKRKTLSDTYTERTVNIKCVKINNEWKIDKIDEGVVDIITSNLVSAAKQISDSFNGHTTDSKTTE